MKSSDTAEPPTDDLAGASAVAPNMADLVSFINAQHGTTFRLTDRLLHGHRNVAGLYNGRNVRFIIKWSPDVQDPERPNEAVRLVDRLRSRWYPAPRYLMRGEFQGGRYSVQTALPGAPIRRLTESHVAQLIALNEIQRGQATPSAAPWPRQIVDDVLEGGGGYCLLRPMRDHSPTTARLLDLVQALASEHRNVSPPTDDVVHFDFQPDNMLGVSGKISGVVDWEGAQPGDRAFDLATLLFYAYDQEPVRDLLWRRIVELTEPAAVALYFAHLIHRQVDWSIRHRDAPVIESWLERARLVWEEIPSRTGYQTPAWP